MKVHGAVERHGHADAWEDNYVITEDDYIGYLSDSPIGQVVPTTCSTKLRYSHFLFLGYAMRDWNLRVFLQRIWRRPARRHVVGDPARAGADRPRVLGARRRRALRRRRCATTSTASPRSSSGSRRPARDRRRRSDAGRARPRQPVRRADVLHRGDRRAASSAATPTPQLIIGNLRASRLTLLYAESGVGKSSLLRAGVGGAAARARADEASRRSAAAALRAGRVQLLERPSPVDGADRRDRAGGRAARRRRTPVSSPARRPRRRARARRRRGRRHAARDPRPVRGVLPLPRARARRAFADAVRRAACNRATCARTS